MHTHTMHIHLRVTLEIMLFGLRISWRNKQEEKYIKEENWTMTLSKRNGFRTGMVQPIEGEAKI